MRYFGKVCQKHHELGGERYKASGSCVECSREYRIRRARRRYIIDPEYRAKKVASVVKFRKRDPAQSRMIANKSYAKNKGKYTARKAAVGRLRRHRQKLAMPKWTTWKEVALKYEEIKSKGLSIDHVIPLAGKLVCGLHCPDNLQGIPLCENIIKGSGYAVS